MSDIILKDTIILVIVKFDNMSIGKLFKNRRELIYITIWLYSKYRITYWDKQLLL